MSETIEWMAAEAEGPPVGREQNWAQRWPEEADEPWRRKKRERWEEELRGMTGHQFPAHQFPQPGSLGDTVAHPAAENAARVEQPGERENPHLPTQDAESLGQAGRFTTEDTEEHRGGQTGSRRSARGDEGVRAYTGEFPPDNEVVVDEPEDRRERRIYRNRTVAMLRRYMVYAIETGRLPSILGREFFQAKVTSYTWVTFEDRVIFVHDMETCLGKLDEFSRQIIGRHVLQEHDQEATGRLLGCTGRTIRTFVPMALDLLSEILLDAGLLERSVPNREKACQGGNSGPFSLSDCEESKNNF